jgi:hypothetical protein
MNGRVTVGVRDLVLFLAGAVCALWLASSSVRAQAPPGLSERGCGDWVIQARQTENVKDFNAFVLNTRTGELFYLKDEHKIPLKTP